MKGIPPVKLLKIFRRSGHFCVYCRLVKKVGIEIGGGLDDASAFDRGLIGGDFHIMVVCDGAVDDFMQAHSDDRIGVKIPAGRRPDGFAVRAGFAVRPYVGEGILASGRQGAQGLRLDLRRAPRSSCWNSRGSKTCGGSSRSRLFPIPTANATPTHNLLRWGIPE